MTDRRKLVLVVDDDADFAAAARVALEAEGLEVACAHDAVDALCVAAARPPDLVVTDLMMARLDEGFRLIARLRELPGCSRLPAVVVTAAAARLGFDFRPRDGADLAAMGAQAFMEKPVAPADLIAGVAALLAPSGDREDEA